MNTGEGLRAVIIGDICFRGFVPEFPNFGNLTFPIFFPVLHFTSLESISQIMELGTYFTNMEKFETTNSQVIAAHINGTFAFALIKSVS